MKEIRLGPITLGYGRPATKEQAPLDGIARGFRSLENPDDLVGSKGLAIFSQMELDPQVKACLSIKKASVLARGWEILAVKEDGARGKQVAEFCRLALTGMDGSILSMLNDVSGAVSKGFSLLNLVWKVGTAGPLAGKWVPWVMKPKDPDGFTFEVDDYSNVTAIVHTGGQRYSPRNFVIYSYRPAYGNPYGTSDLRACYRNWWSKDFLTRFWNLYLEKFGSPTAVGKFRRGTPRASQDALLDILARIRQQSAIVIPDDQACELLETIRQGDVGYRIAVEFHNREIAKSILGMTLITDDGGQGIGSFALAKVHLDVLRMCLQGYKRDLEETVMVEQVLRPMVAYNFGVDVPVPAFSLGPLEQRELEPMSRSAKNLVDAGIVDPADPVLKEWLGLQGFGPAPETAPSVSRSRVDGDTNDGKVQVA